jgi:EpsI family protein
MTAGTRDWAVVAILGVALAAGAHTRGEGKERLAMPLERIGRRIAGWKAVRDEVLGDRTLSRLAPTEYLARTYEKDGRQIGVFVAYYATQRAGESLHSPKRCLPGAGWTIRHAGEGTVEMPGGRVGINSYLIERPGKTSAVLYWYQTGSRVVASEYRGKLLLLWDALREGRQSGSIVRLTFDRAPGAEDEALRFAGELIPLVEHCLTGGSRWGSRQ